MLGPRAKIHSPPAGTKSLHRIVSCTTTGKTLLYLHTFTIVKLHLEIKKKILRFLGFFYPKHNLEIYFLVILSNLHATKWIKDHLLDKVEILLLRFELQVSYFITICRFLCEDPAKHDSHMLKKSMPPVHQENNKQK